MIEHDPFPEHWRRSIRRQFMLMGAPEAEADALIQNAVDATNAAFEALAGVLGECPRSNLAGTASLALQLMAIRADAAHESLKAQTNALGYATSKAVLESGGAA